MNPPSTPRSAESRYGWIAPVLWTLAFVGCAVIGLVFSQAFREIFFEGIGYMWAFFTTPFILEGSVFLIGLITVFIINNLRIDREGDGWVEMEVKTAASDDKSKQEQPE